MKYHLKTGEHSTPQKSADRTPVSSPLTSPTTTTTTTTTNSTLKLEEVDYQNFNNMFETLDKKKFWELSTGTIVELKMKELALKNNTEQ